MDLAASPTCASTRITLGAIALRRAPVTSKANATFSSAVRSSSRRKSWNTIPIRLRSLGTSRRFSSAVLNPETRTEPDVGCSSAEINRSTVDFPAPEWPVKNTNSPLVTWNDTSFSAREPLGYALKTLENRITARVC
jgi:hypothetical protein